MQDVPVECSIDATEVEQMACEAPKKPGDNGGMTTQDQSHPAPTPTPTPTPTPSPK